MQMQEIQENIENIQPNNSPQLAQLIRDNLSYQNQQSIKRTLFKQSMVKISIDKNFQNLFELPNETFKTIKNDSKKLIQVSEELKTICSWLEDSDAFRGMAYLPFVSTPKLFHLLHQKVQNTVIVITQYHSYWMEQMQQISRLSKIQWGFLNLYQKNEEKVKILQLYEMNKTKLFFVSPSLFKHEQYHEFDCDLLVFADMHLFKKSTDLMEKIIEKCTPNRVLGLYSTPLYEAYPFQKYKMSIVNKPQEKKKACICLKTNLKEKLKTLLTYIEKHEIRRALVIVNNKNEAKQVSKILKLKALTSFNLLQALTPQQMNSFNPSQIIKGPKNQEKVLDTIYKSQNYNITLTKYFDGLRFGNYDCVIFYSFTDVPKFLQSVPDINHRLLLLADDDYHIVRNNITSDHLTGINLMKIVMKIMEKPKKVESTVYKRFYSGYMEDQLLDTYSVTKEYVERDQEKVIKSNWFCKTHEISPRVLNRVLEDLDKNNVIRNLCKVVFEIQIQESSLGLLRKKFPEVVQIKKKINILNFSTSAKKTTRTLLQELRNAGIQYKITEEAIQIRVLKNYEDVDWQVLQKTVNENVWQSVKDLDKSYIIYKNCSYGSIQLTRREKYLQRKNALLTFHEQNDNPLSLNIFNSFHKSNLLTSEIEQWLKHSYEIFRDEHDLVLILQGVDNPRFARFREDAIYGRYRRVRYEDLLGVVTRIRKNKKTKLE